MFVAVGAIIAGVVVLATAADQFVLGAARVALIRRVPSLIVGVVIVGFGTSTPELLVSGIAASDDEAEIAVGNIVGSNVANLSLLLGVGALIIALSVSSTTVKREAPLVLGAVAMFGLAVQGGGIARWEGAVLLALLAPTLWITTRRSAADPIAAEVEELAEPSEHRLGIEVVRTALGLVATIGSAQLLLWGALEVSRRAELSEAFVGATLVAIGTSLPELVTVVQSARRKETDLIVGNLLGSNLFNSLAVGGVVGLVGGTGVDAPELTIVAAGAAVAVAAFAWLAMVTSHKVTRIEGAVLIAGYLVVTPLLA